MQHSISQNLQISRSPALRTGVSETVDAANELSRDELNMHRPDMLEGEFHMITRKHHQTAPKSDLGQAGIPLGGMSSHIPSRSRERVAKSPVLCKNSEEVMTPTAS